MMLAPNLRPEGDMKKFLLLLAARIAVLIIVVVIAAITGLKGW
jgi:hypothetical protein